MSAPKQLADVNWKLNLQLSHSKMASTKLPSAMIELSLADAEDEKRKTQPVVLEFTKEELTTFYIQLEEMQKQLDALL